MLNIFSPAVALMRRSKYPYKFAVVGIGAVAAIIFLLGSLLVSLWASVETGQREMSGLDIIKPTLRFVQLVQQHRGLSSAVLRGDDKLKEKTKANEVEVAEELKRIDAALAKYGASPVITQQWTDLKKGMDRTHG